jgi:energy-coupling factor transporter ATP-binding protein EcfA2
MERAELEVYLSREADIVDEALLRLGMRACVSGVVACGGAYVLYRLHLDGAQRMASLQSIVPDLSQRVASYRGRNVRLRLREHPLSIEAEHPAPSALSWRNAVLGGHNAHSMLVGAEYTDGRRHDVWLSFDDAPHILVAGTTGSGKSTVLRSVLTSLCWSTAPRDLALYLVDLKNEDLVPYAGLPHVLGFAGSDRLAQATLAQVEAELDRRIAGSSAAQRIVLVVDELAQLTDDAKQRLGRILALGRSKRVNVIAATQHPTAKLVGEKTNYSVRLIGRVADASTSALCTGRPGVGAEMLPGRGAFVLVDGADLRRIQAYAFGSDVAPALVSVIADRHPKTGAKPVSEHPSEPEKAVLVVKTGAKPVSEPVVETRWPLPMRPPTASEADAIRNLASTMSLNKLILLAYGSKNRKTYDWIKEVL